MSRQKVVIPDSLVFAGEVHRIEVTDERNNVLVNIRLAVYADFKGMNVDVTYEQSGVLQIAMFQNGDRRILAKETTLIDHGKTVSIELKTEV